ncbi:hypothetical protein PB2503_08714 [Parvularcula bermudensis HTCC2503]|uniref:Pyrroline-5-carboxylate reductase n=1 Tax=Parvularcula bermudensis (strain ATCC BAA-594 / HTCC2503 / KCTC 12087) TaxID=314260 RepID=E0TC05_PARBH|nr:accessory factor UbiK family protein [Parvularcula bermudensis]ADM09798.1 hypothetical protein PB2503_08714 [Parvularcula bermudensis HTCC2503]
MQTKNPVLDGLAKAVSEAAGMADGVRREAETVMHSQLQRFLAENDLVTREEFEAVQEMAAKALDELETVKAELASLKSGA